MMRNMNDEVGQARGKPDGGMQGVAVVNVVAVLLLQEREERGDGKEETGRRSERFERER